MPKGAIRLVAAFALAAGAAGAFIAAAPGQKPEAQAKSPAKSAAPAPSITADFNNHAKNAVLYRNLDRNVKDEPLIIKEENGRYLVDEPNNFLQQDFGNTGHLQSYSKEALIEKHGPLDKIRTFEQYKADSDVLHKTPGLGMNLEGASFSMRRRIADIQADMKQAGETFAPAQPQPHIQLPAQP